MKTFLHLIVTLFAIFIAACTPTIAPATLSFDKEYTIHNGESVYIADESLPDETVVYLRSQDGHTHWRFTDMTEYSTWYTQSHGQAVQHFGTLLTLHTGPQDTSKSLPYGGQTTPEPTPTPIPGGTIVFHDSFTWNNEIIYVDSKLPDHRTHAIGLEMKDGGIFDQWYTIDGNQAVKHHGSLTLKEGYQYSDAGWSFQIK